MISVFDIFTIGIGPSSSHTVGPMRASFRFCQELSRLQHLTKTTHITTNLYGSLGQTGIGHGTGKAIILGLGGFEPETIKSDIIDSFLSEVEKTEIITLIDGHQIKFPRKKAIVFHRRKTLPLHSNALTISAYNYDTLLYSNTYYSVGGGFIVDDIQMKDFSSDKLSDLNGSTSAIYPF